MTGKKSQHVHRYFELADSFVAIHVLEQDGLDLPVLNGLDRVGYRRLVIGTCMPDFGGEVAQAMDDLFPEDPLLAEDLLYQLCVEVNPQLEIHRVRVRARKRRDDDAPEPASAPAAAGGEDLLRRLPRRARGLERRLRQRLFGQDEAVRRVARQVEKAAVGLSSPDRPLGCFLFVGRTGTGKTELARLLAKDLFGERDGRGLVRIDCSEFSLPHEYAKLIGSPPGYIGHEDGGQLTEALRKNPETLVLFDEVEKAHPRMHNLLLQILEEGALTDGKGERVGFDRSFVVMTSNAGAAEVQSAGRAVGFHSGEQLGDATLTDITRRALERQFSPEFLGRLDEVVVFKELEQDTVRSIAQRLLTELAMRARARHFAVSFTPAVARWVAERGWSPDFGARELRHVIQREIEPPLARLLLDGHVRPGQLVRARIQGGRPSFEVED